MSGKAQAEGSWGEYLQTFFDSSKVKVQNYANGGRSSRNFINEGSLDKIKANIKEGDYLFIQFGHNDCANGKGYLEEIICAATDSCDEFALWNNGGIPERAGDCAELFRSFLYIRHTGGK